MTAPGYIPPPVPGWWVKGNFVLFPTPASLTLTGSTPRVTVGPTVSPTPASLTLTGSAPRVTVGPTVFPAAASLTLSGGTPRLVTTVAPSAASMTLTGGTPLVGAQYFDDFNRADDGASLGANWTNRLNTMGIYINTAYPVTLLGVNSFATYNGAMIFDDVRVTATVGAIEFGGRDFHLILGANTTGQGARFTYDQSSGDFVIYSMTAWGAQVQRNIDLTATIAAGDVFVFERIGNVYTAYKNGGQVCTWTDSTNIVPRDSSHRLVGIGGTHVGGNFTRLDNWSAVNI